MKETMLSLLLITSTLGYMFWVNLAAENMIDSAGSIPLSTYNTNWYETSVATQKLLQLIILNGNRGLMFNLLSIYVPSLEGFSVLLQTSVSYFTVLLSLQ
ncbi:odorant receptor 4-like [Megachile rotundata]|uniref:odorant receptor 4-like n=1 Tax=Megachile rotundata TaxID=143995 RepID=UPI003FCFD3D9